MELNLDGRNIIKEIYKQGKIKRYFEFIIGCLCVALAFNLFYSPNEIVAGGVSGFSILLKHFFGFNQSYVIMIGNILLLILSYFVLGKEITRMNLLGSLLLPIFINLTEHLSTYISFQQSEMILVAIFGGILQGTGAGLIFRAGFSTGGTDILNMIVSRKFQMSMGSAMIFTDGLIVLFGFFAFGFNRLIYALLVLYLVSITTDRVLLGISDSKAFYIITKEDQKVKQFIMNDMHHGVTIFEARGGYKKEVKNVLMCVIPTKEYYKLKEGIHLIDKEAFFVVTDSYQVIGGE